MPAPNVLATDIFASGIFRWHLKCHKTGTILIPCASFSFVFLHFLSRKLQDTRIGL
jgi:hypothetical protein